MSYSQSANHVAREDGAIRYLTSVAPTACVKSRGRLRGWSEEDGADMLGDLVDIDEIDSIREFRVYRDEDKALAYAAEALSKDFFGAVMVYKETFCEEEDDWIAEGWWEVSHEGPLWSYAPEEVE